MNKLYLVVILICGLLITEAHGEILLRSTFEEYEGSPWDNGWVRDPDNDDYVRQDEEEPYNEYQKQAHGALSLHISDPNDTSYANAYKTFDNDSSEYMLEFYLWISSERGAKIDSFPLCVLWSMPEAYKTDIALVLDTLNTPPNGYLFTISVEDAQGMYSGAYVDSTDRWYKIQIHRYEEVVDFYFEGELEGTYTPMNSEYVSNTISLGTTSDDSLSNGEVFYDDVIIIDYSDLRNQITQIQHKIRQIEGMIAGTNYTAFRQYFTKEDMKHLLSLSNLVSANYAYLTNYERLSYFNDLTVRLNQIKLGFMYGDLGEGEKNMVKKIINFDVDEKINTEYSQQ